MAELRCGSCGTAAPGPTDWRCGGVRLAARARAAAGRSGDVRRRRRRRACGAIAAGCRTSTPSCSGSRRRRWSTWATRVTAKLEGGLPTGSFKDRGTAVTVSWLRAHGVQEIVVDSSGNAGASFAAYAARAGVRLRLFVPADASPAKLLQARAHGATVVAVPGPRSAAGEAARRSLEGAGPDVAYGSHLWQPAFLAGTATFAYEVFEGLGGRAPDAVVAPLGGGTLLLGVHLGFTRLRAAGLIDRDARVSSASRATPARRWPGRSVTAKTMRSRSRRARRSPRASASTARRARSRSWPRSATPGATSSR